MASEMVTDRWEGVRNHESVVVAPSLEAILEAIRALDGDVRTIVSIVYRGPSHMEIGGGGVNGLYVVQSTDDGERYRVATRHDAPASMKVMVTAGGQEGDYLARHCVDLRTALRAATTFASTGALDQMIEWEDG